MPSFKAKRNFVLSLGKEHTAIKAGDVFSASADHFEKNLKAQGLAEPHESKQDSEEDSSKPSKKASKKASKDD